MIEDKLSVHERIRLESVSQANLCRQTTPQLSARPVPGYTPDPVAELLEAATRIESYIITGKP